MMTGQMRDRPKLSWTTEPSALYTVVLSDEALEAVLGEGNDYIHWVVTNIPGNDIKAGNEMFQFIQPWVAQSDSEKHPYLALVFKQRGKVRWDLHITMRGPKLDRLAQYGAGLSLLNPPSLLNTIRNTKSIGISTGAVKETQAYFGVFGNVRANGVGNLSSTLEGQVKDSSSLGDICH